MKAGGKGSSLRPGLEGMFPSNFVEEISAEEAGVRKEGNLIKCQLILAWTCIHQFDHNAAG